MLFVVIFGDSLDCPAQNSQPTKYQIEAAFVYNFARFVDWPTQAFTDASSPMVIGVYGKNPFGTDLARMIGDKRIGAHPLQVRECASLSQAMNCQVLFISDSEKNRLPKIISSLGRASILTVSESDDFIAEGGMINLRIINDKVRFEINNSAAKSAGLAISSKLLSLAIRVR
ncbi:MAG: YfiR family protein [Limisphaerales bacterium]